MRLDIVVALIFLLVALMGCEKDEMPVSPPQQPGDLKTVQIPMGKFYDKQLFFDLSSGTTVSTNLRTDWDLGFESSSDGYRIVLNTSKLMLAQNTESTDFNGIKSTTDAMWKWDVTSGNLDSTAIGNWGEYKDRNVASYRHVYIIDRGRNPDGSNIGIKKIVFERLQNNAYALLYSNLDGTEENNFTIEKDDNYNYNLVYFSFEGGGKQVQVAPEKNSWDLAFTMYTHIFSETPANIPQPDTLIPYLVNGVLQNRQGVTVVEDLNSDFDSIEYSSVASYLFEQNRIDEIGYDWKLYDFNKRSYTIVPGKNYIIKDTEGYYYKLHFIDFYSDSGEKGYPKFEYQRL